MAIGTVVQRGASICIYNERGQQTGSVAGGDLQGYTTDTVSVRRGSSICIYDERGRQLSSTYAPPSRSTSGGSGSGSSSSSSSPNPLLFAIVILAAVIGSATGLIKPSSEPDAYQQAQDPAPEAAPDPPTSPESPIDNAPPAELWGGFAVSPSSGATGWSKGYGSESEAQQAAVQSCGHDDCRAFTFTAGGAALVESDTRWYHDSGRSSEEEASNLALEQCRSQEPEGNCRVVTTLRF